jgi:hypothetical protein
MKPEPDPSPTRARPEPDPSPTRARPEPDPSPTRARPEPDPSPTHLITIQSYICTFVCQGPDLRIFGDSQKNPVRRVCHVVHPIHSGRGGIPLLRCEFSFQSWKEITHYLCPSVQVHRVYLKSHSPGAEFLTYFSKKNVGENWNFRWGKKVLKSHFPSKFRGKKVGLVRAVNTVTFDKISPIISIPISLI